MCLMKNHFIYFLSFLQLQHLLELALCPIMWLSTTSMMSEKARRTRLRRINNVSRENLVGFQNCNVINAFESVLFCLDSHSNWFNFIFIKWNFRLSWLYSSKFHCGLQKFAWNIGCLFMKNLCVFSNVCGYMFEFILATSVLRNYTLVIIHSVHLHHETLLNGPWWMNYKLWLLHLEFMLTVL